MEDNKKELVADEEGMIEMVTVISPTSLLQKYDDGRPDKVWSIGDTTTDGKIVEFKKEHTYWCALTDTPSEWQKNNGYKNGWAWIFQLKSVE